MANEEKEKYLNRSIDELDLLDRMLCIESEIKSYIMQNIEAIGYEELYLFKEILAIFKGWKI